MKKLVLALCALGLLGGSTSSLAATQCHDKHGKFVKCSDKLTAKPKACRDAHGKFIKCKK